MFFIWFRKTISPNPPHTHTPPGNYKEKYDFISSCMFSQDEDCDVVVDEHIEEVDVST